MPNKLKLIFLPFLLIGISYISFYTFLNWFLFVHLDLFLVKEEIINIGLPLILLSLPLLIWLKPRIALLDFKNQKNAFYYLVIAGLLLAIPTLIAQSYMNTATSKLIELTTIQDITKEEKVKFYKIKDYFVFKKGAKLHFTAEATGKYNQKLTGTLYIALPIYESRRQKTKQVAAWLGLKYHKTINNHLSDVEKERKFEEFLETTESAVNKRNLRELVFFQRAVYSSDFEAYFEAIKDSSKLDDPIVLVPMEGSYAERNGMKPFWLVFTSISSLFIWSLLLRKPKLNAEKYQMYLNKNFFSRDNDLWCYLQLFIPRNGYFVTPILINLNVAIFLILFFSGAGFMTLKPKVLMNWGANYTPYTLQGEYWRLLASTFLHGGIIHLICNMGALIFVGLYLESLLGSLKLILVYFCTALLSSLATVYWYKEMFSVGASGAILGLYGVFLAFLMPKTVQAEMPTSLLNSVITIIVFSLMYGFIANNVDNAAHLSGLASGFLLGILIDRDRKIALKLSFSSLID